MGGGRGNLRENREDPAPTVGVAGLKRKAEYSSRRGTPRRYVLREPELPGLNHFTRNKGKAPITHKRLNPYGSFAAVSLLEYGGLKPILPFLEGRSDAACRVVICLRRSRCCLRGVNDGHEGAMLRSTMRSY